MWQSSLLAWGIVLLANVVVRTVLYSANYQGISLFCGDSAFYVGLARGDPPAAADRPSGFPFFLKILFAFSESTTFLLMVACALAIGAQLLCWRLLSPRFLSPLGGALLTSALFLDPIAVKTSSMVFMADTLAVFLLCWAIYLILPPGRSIARGMCGLSVLGYLSIVKYSFLYVGIAACAVYVLREIGRPGRRGIAAAKAALVLTAAFLAIPCTYAIVVNWRFLGTYSLDNFGGRSMLATIAPGASCEELLESCGEACAGREVSGLCRDDQLATHGSVLLWTRGSPISEIARKVAGTDPVATNRLLRRMALRLALRHPEQVGRAIAQYLREHASRLDTSQVTVRQRVSVGGGCDRLVRDFFRMEPDDYLRRWEEAQGPWVDRIDGVARVVTRLTNVLSLVALAAVLIARPRWLVLGSEPLMLSAMTFVYGASVMIGSPYDARIAWVLDLLCVLTAVVALSIGRRRSRVATAAQ